jgi:hypothetical protein
MQINGRPRTCRLTDRPPVAIRRIRAGGGLTVTPISRARPAGKIYRFVAPLIP